VCKKKKEDTWTAQGRNLHTWRFMTLRIAPRAKEKKRNSSEEERETELCNERSEKMTSIRKTYRSVVTQREEKGEPALDRHGKRGSALWKMKGKKGRRHEDRGKSKHGAPTKGASLETATGEEKTYTYRARQKKEENFWRGRPSP